MNIIKYELLLAAVKHGSISEAAEELFYSQPGATNMLNSLEKELGVQLLDRKRGRVRLTTEGEKLFPSIQRIVEDQRDILESIRAMKGLLPVRLFIGVSHAILPQYFLGSIPSIRETHPELDIWLRTGYCPDLFKWMENGEIQVALMPLLGGEGYVEIPLRKDEIVAVCGKDVPCILSEDHPVTERELAEAFAASGGTDGTSTSGELLSWKDRFNLTMMEDYASKGPLWQNLELTLALRQFAESGDVCDSVRIFELEGSPEASIGAVYREGEKESAAIKALVGLLR